MAASRSFDPQVQQIATVYAKGFLQAAQGQLADLAAVAESVEELEAVRLLCEQQPRFADRLASTRFSHADKCQLLQRTLGQHGSKLVLNFLGVVCRHGRFELLPTIVEQTRHLYNQRSGIVDVTVTSAVPLEDEVAQRMVQRLAQVLGKQVELQREVDPALLGGLQVRVGDTVFDGSVNAGLERARRTAFERSAERIRGQFDRFVSVD